MPGEPERWRMHKIEGETDWVADALKSSVTERKYQCATRAGHEDIKIAAVCLNYPLHKRAQVLRMQSPFASLLSFFSVGECLTHWTKSHPYLRTHYREMGTAAFNIMFSSDNWIKTSPFKFNYSSVCFRYPEQEWILNSFYGFVDFLYMDNLIQYKWCILTYNTIKQWLDI